MAGYRRFSVMLGSPGAGKDTQLELLEAHTSAQILYIGQTIRRAAETNTKIVQYLESGGLVPQEIITQLYQLKLQEYESTDWLISDGFPRSLEQAEWLNSILAQSFTKISDVVLLEVSKQQAIQRLQTRARHDDTNTIVAHRFETFYEQTGPVIDYYESVGLLKRVSGEGSVEQVHGRLCEALGVNQ